MSMRYSTGMVNLHVKLCPLIMIVLLNSYYNFVGTVLSYR